MRRRRASQALTLTMTLALALALALALPLALSSTASTESSVGGNRAIELAGLGYCAGPQVLLGEIALIDVDDPQLREALEKLELGTAPLPGSSRRLNLGQIQVRMRQQRIDPAMFSFSGPLEVIVHASSQLVSAASIGDAAKQGLAAAAGFALSCEHLRVARADYPGGVQAPPGVITLETKVALPGADMQFVRVTVGVKADSVLVRNANVWIEITAPAAVLRGNEVTILAQVGHVQVAALGVALEDGRPGERIRVRNTVSGAELTARVHDSSTVRVILDSTGVPL